MEYSVDLPPPPPPPPLCTGESPIDISYSYHFIEFDDDIHEMLYFASGACHPFWNWYFELVIPCILLNIIIIVISIFGHIKEDYVYFVCNHAIFELIFLVLLLNCNEPRVRNFNMRYCVQDVLISSYSCFPGHSVIGVNDPVFTDCLIKFVTRYLRWNFNNEQDVIVSTLFLLTFSRFLVIQKSDLYDRLFHRKFLVVNIIAFDLLIHTFYTILGYYDYLSIDPTILGYNLDAFLALKTLTIFESIMIGINALLLLLGIFLSSTIIFRLVKRLKFQVNFFKFHEV